TATPSTTCRCWKRWTSRWPSTPTRAWPPSRASAAGACCISIDGIAVAGGVVMDELAGETTMSARDVIPSSLAEQIDSAAQAVEARVLAWRRDLHAHPELGNREFRTAAIVAALLREIGLDEVRTEVAHTGVVGLLKGALPGPVVALRADMDALPVTEAVDVPFASKLRTQWNNEEVGVMH